MTVSDVIAIVVLTVLVVAELYIMGKIAYCIVHYIVMTSRLRHKRGRFSNERMGRKTQGTTGTDEQR